LCKRYGDEWQIFPAGVMDLTYSDVENILKLVDSAEHLDEIEIVYNGFRLRAVRGNGIASSPPTPPLGAVVAATPGPSLGATTPAAPRAAARADNKPIPAGVTVVRAPMVGTFYRAPAPGDPPFVEVGHKVRADDTVCLIEVMKLFNSIRAGVDGTVVEIRAENGALVEHNEPLILIAPGKG
jgi:acetyl-CoA carboxylase biotin carboxyl carrier protein